MVFPAEREAQLFLPVCHCQCATVSDHSLHGELGFLCLTEQILTEAYKANKTLEHLVA